MFLNIFSFFSSMGDHVFAVSDFDLNCLREFYELRGNKDCTLWSPGEIEFLSQVSPLSVSRVNRALGTNYPLERSAFDAQARAKSANLISTADNCILSGYANRDIALSRLRDLADLLEIEGLECPLKEEALIDSNSLMMVAASKLLAIKYLEGKNPSFGSYILLEPGKENVNNHELSPQRMAARFNAVSFFKNVFGRNLDRIIEYETSTQKGSHTSHFFVLLRDIDMESYLKIRQGKGKISHQRKVALSLMLTQFLGAYAASNYHSRVIHQNGTLIYGNTINFPEISDKEYIDMFFMRAGLDLNSLRAALATSSVQENMARNFVYALKLLNYEKLIRTSLLQKEQGRQISVDDVRKYDPFRFNALPRDPTIEQVKEALYETNFRVKQRVCTYMSTLSKP